MWPKSPNNDVTIGRWVHLPIAAIMVLFGIGNITFWPEPKVVQSDIGDQVVLIGIGELIAAALLMWDETLRIGAFLTAAFFGGTIVFQMFVGANYALQLAFLVAVGVGWCLRES